MVTECFSVAHSTVHCLWNRVVHTRVHGHIISPEFQSHKKLQETSYLSVGVRPRGNEEHPITQATDLTEFRQPLQVQSHLEMPGILVQLGHIQCT